MKRALAMALGAMMVAGSAAPASAASHIDFSGYYRVNYMMDMNRGHGSEGQSFTDSYFDDRLLIEMTFSPTDEIAVHWQLRGPNRQRWGTGTRVGNLVTQHVYGEIKQDWGTVLIGRLDDGLDQYGLATLGYAPGFGPYQYYSPFDDGAVRDGIRYSNRWDNGFGMLAQYVKVEANTDDDGRSDEDWDRVQLEGSYLWDGGGASLGFQYDRSATHSYPNTGDGYAMYRAPNRGFYGLQNKTDAFYVNPAIMHSWGNFSVHFEGMAGWATTDYLGYKLNADGTTWRSGTHSFDSDGYGAYLDFDYNYGPGNVNLAAWWVSGSDLGDKDSSSLVDFGGNFYPLLVAYGYTGNGNWRGNTDSSINSQANSIGIANNAFTNFILPALADTNYFLNDDTKLIASAGLDAPNQFFYNDRARFTSFNYGTDANHWAVSLSGNHAFTDDITMHYAVAYLALNNPNYSVVNKANLDANGIITGRPSMHKQDKDLGFEIDLGFRFQLLDNLSLLSSFGYMFTGDAYKELRGYNVVKDAAGNNVAAKAKWRDGDDSYVWYNTLQFNF